MLESRSADQRLIKSLKRELDVAVELEAAAEARAAAAEKTASALKKQIETPLGAKPASERIAELESDLNEANEILAEFKQSWEADRKVIALLSQMKDAEEAKDAADAARLADAAAKAKDDSDGEGRRRRKKEKRSRSRSRCVCRNPSRTGPASAGRAAERPKQPAPPGAACGALWR